ncbi:MAG: Rpp14/Pop5 family protein [Halobacteriales archaeon]|nr:Rpp14/Pop5 family protein [Halobacteriales archaeon]
MSPLPKHLRPRYRYLAVALEAWPGTALDESGFREALVSSVRSLFGDAGVAAADPRVIRFSFGDGAGQAIVRTRRDAVDTARAGLAAIDAVDGAPLAVCVRGISGTVRGCEERYLAGRQLRSRESTVVFDGAERRATIRDSRVDVHLETGFAGATDLDTT